MTQQATIPQGVTFTNQDILPHINASDSLAQMVSSISGCITVLAFAGCKLDACYEIHNNAADVQAILKTPIGDVSLGKATLDWQHPKVTLGGGIDSFKAEVTIELLRDPIRIKVCGKVCAPFVGCASGCAGATLAE